MFYKQQLELARKNNIIITSLEVANEVDCIFEGLPEQDFEKACALVEEAYMKSEDLSINQLTRALEKLRKEDGLKLENINRHQLIDEACYM